MTFRGGRRGPAIGGDGPRWSTGVCSAGRPTLCSSTLRTSTARFRSPSFRVRAATSHATTTSSAASTAGWLGRMPVPPPERILPAMSGWSTTISGRGTGPPRVVPVGAQAYRRLLAPGAVAARGGLERRRVSERGRASRMESARHRSEPLGRRDRAAPLWGRPSTGHGGDVTGEADVVVMLDVLEHLVDPLAALKHLRLSMHDDGMLALSTVNVAGLHARMRRESGRGLSARICTTSRPRRST